MIPKTIYQSWKTKTLPDKMAENVKNLVEMNPEYTYVLCDDDECRNLLLDNFGVNYANAFDSLIPGAFKCDLWRYAILYLYGGVYLDIDIKPILPFREILSGNESFVSVADRSIMTMKCGMYQAFIGCTPRHPIMLYALQLSFANIVTRRNEIFDSLSITGPIVAGIALNLYWEKKNPYESVKAGKYGDILLFRNDGEFIRDENERKLLQDKYEGYERGMLDYTTKTPYHNDPRSRIRKIIYCILGLLLLVAIGGVIYSYYFKKKYNQCVSESMSSREFD